MIIKLIKKLFPLPITPIEIEDDDKKATNSTESFINELDKRNRENIKKIKEANAMNDFFEKEKKKSENVEVVDDEGKPLSQEQIESLVENYTDADGIKSEDI